MLILYMLCLLQPGRQFNVYDDWGGIEGIEGSIIMQMIYKV